MNACTCKTQSCNICTTLQTVPTTQLTMSKSLSRLKYLNLENNEIASIPHLRLLGGRIRHKEEVNEVNDKQNSMKLAPDRQQESRSEEEGKEMTYEDKEGRMIISIGISSSAYNQYIIYQLLEYLKLLE